MPGTVLLVRSSSGVTACAAFYRYDLIKEDSVNTESFLMLLSPTAQDSDHCRIHLSVSLPSAVYHPAT